ncbi:MULTISPECIES: hemolysin family protein [Rhizobium/Agrobacterium group]|uniref:hemolysin family protein n=1 Tax=Rhizobium/Agrobacterium group TaxID=227290 RepID=UPI0012E90D9B|nr:MULTISPECIES: hemolysin family protein [Rhizobium/Agrobacterium group]MCF1474364.1 HlyC/CorC family transporter [Allorhizobium ampelinum]MVA51660.1 CBS domain-containing protein [Agrobacterium vitis]MVA71196.1 CBS domain-containing protein [Agrobacterium vitis]NSZ51623.1 HlyC/CorC family transporter [Agrobacterium vitis]NTA30382.1 HlyC/CorC family transporter [Agrobacterium vitis]
MSDFSTRSASEATKEQDGSSSEEGSSPQRSSAAHKPQSSFWARAARILKPTGASLREDIADALMSDRAAEEAFSAEERAMLHNILRFREVRVEDVMVPRSDIHAVDVETSIGELMTLFQQTGHSRMPVYCDTLDDPRGMVHIRDLLSYITLKALNGNGLDLACVDLGVTLEEAGIIRSILFVPPSMQASDLLARMQAARTQMALVIDEYGGTDGLVSHEDIVEMVVGDIEDEHDKEEALVTRVSQDVYLADARIELEEIAEVIGPDFDISAEIDEVDTLGGLLSTAIGRVPQRGEVVQAVAGFELHILDADPRRVKKVRITRMAPIAKRLQEGADLQTVGSGQGK